MGINGDSLSEDLRIISHHAESRQCSAERRSVQSFGRFRVAEANNGCRSGWKNGSNSGHIRDYRAVSLFRSGLEHVSWIIHIEKIRPQ